METMVEVRATVRREMLDRVVGAVKDAGVPRFSVLRIHSIGTGVDPARAKISWDEGSEYADKAVVQVICSQTESGRISELIAKAARTGRKGDGIVTVYPVQDILKIRTGVRGPDALA